MDNIVKKILNSLRCPVCKAPIDMLSSRRDYNYGCAVNADHYAIYLIGWEPPVRIERETVNIYDKKHKYSITKSTQNGKLVTEIEVYETDLENRVIFNFKDKKMVMDKEVFDFTNFKVDKALNRIKTIFVFQ